MGVKERYGVDECQRQDDDYSVAMENFWGWQNLSQKFKKHSPNLETCCTYAQSSQ